MSSAGCACRGVGLGAPLTRRQITARFDDPNDGAGGGLAGAGREIGKFIARRWSPAKYDLVFYVNPDAEQSVRGLSHAHILARPKRCAMSPAQ